MNGFRLFPSSRTAENRAAENRAIASAMTALSHPRRVAIFTILEAAGPHGATLERLLAESGLALSTLRHHLDRMERSELVRRRRHGVEVRFSIESAPLLGVCAAMVSRLNATRPMRAA